MDHVKSRHTILFVSDFTFVHTIGGTEVATARLLNGLAEQGKFEIYLFSWEPKNGYRAIEPHQDIRIETFPMVATPGDKGFNNFILPNPFKMWKLLKKIAPDIVHIHTPSPFGYMALLMAKSLHIPLVYTSHMFSEHIVVETNTWSKQMARKVVDVLFAGYMRKFDTIIYPSPIQQDIMTAKYDLRNNAVAISNGSIPFGENASAEKPDTWRDKTVFFTISRLSKEKNIHRLLNAFDRVHEQHANAILVVVGDGIARKELETSARQKASSDSIFFVGQQRGDALARYFKTGDVFVSASDRESEGLTTLEAVSFGKPLILSDAPGNAARQFLEWNGFLYQAWNDEDLANKMLAYMADPTLVSRFGEKSLQISELYRFEHSLEKIKKVYEAFIRK